MVGVCDQMKELGFPLSHPEETELTPLEELGIPFANSLPHTPY